MANKQTGAAVHIKGPSRLITDRDGLGPNPRLRVDVAQTSFFAGREFRTFHEFDLTGASQVFKVVATKNIILFGLSVEIISGEVKLETVIGGSEGGSFSTSLPIIGRNTMTSRPTPFYEATTTVTTGGTHTDGTVLDVLLSKTSSNAVFAGRIGTETSDERGVPAGTYYFRLTTVGATHGVFRGRWEERPEGI